MTEPPDPRDALRDEDPVQLGRESRSSIPVVRPAVDADPGADPSGPGTPPAFWQGFVDRRETVLWFGAPDAERLAARKPRAAGPAWLAFYGIGMATGLALLVRDMGGYGVKVTGMILFVLAGLQIARALDLGGKQLRQTHYLLTDRAAYIARVHPGTPASVQRYEITAGLPVRATDSSVTFVVGMRRRGGGREGNAQNMPIVVGFSHIKDAAVVRDLVRRIQKGPR